MACAVTGTRDCGRFADLRFELLGVCVGTTTIVIDYRNQRGGLASEGLVFEGLSFIEGHGTYLEGAPYHGSGAAGSPHLTRAGSRYRRSIAVADDFCHNVNSDRVASVAVKHRRRRRSEPLLAAAALREFERRCPARARVCMCPRASAGAQVRFYLEGFHAQMLSVRRA
jgi:hypothetical protein